jgi:hypothetical protein
MTTRLWSVTLMLLEAGHMSSSSQIVCKLVQSSSCARSIAFRGERPNLFSVGHQPRLLTKVNAKRLFPAVKLGSDKRAFMKGICAPLIKQGTPIYETQRRVSSRLAFTIRQLVCSRLRATPKARLTPLPALEHSCSTPLPSFRRLRYRSSTCAPDPVPRWMAPRRRHRGSARTPPWHRRQAGYRSRGRSFRPRQRWPAP